MFSKEKRTNADNIKLGVLFGFFGGFNNATAIAILLYEIAPMSANWGGMAEALGRMDFLAVFTFLPLLISFITGAFLGGKWVEDHEPTPLVFVESGLLMLIALIAPHNTILAIAIGALAMGLQNGMSTRISHKAVRTSHLTSTVTDIGICLAMKEYASASVKIVKLFTYVWGATVGITMVQITHQYGHVTFAMGGAALFVIISCHTIYLKYTSGKPETVPVMQG